MRVVLDDEDPRLVCAHRLIVPLEAPLLSAWHTYRRNCPGLLVPWHPVRALLVYNPNATTTTPAVTDVITKALSAELKLDVEATKRRDHASFLAAGAVHEGYEVVISLGGDGTMNEVMQGIAGSNVKLAIIPGGSTNVWARTFGLPNDAVEATSIVLGKLREGADRRVTLGRANGRWFGFTAGFGFDAEAVHAVERRARMKRTVRQAAFIWGGFLANLGGFDRRTAMSLTTADGETTHGLRSAVACNSDPWTYFQRWPVRLAPQTKLDGGLDVVGLTRTGFGPVLRLARAALLSGHVERLRFVRSWHDLDGCTVTADRPTPLQVDGDYLGEVEKVQLHSVPHALTLVA